MCTHYNGQVIWSEVYMRVHIRSANNYTILASKFENILYNRITKSICATVVLKSGPNKAVGMTLTHIPGQPN